MTLQNVTVHDRAKHTNPFISTVAGAVYGNNLLPLISETAPQVHHQPARWHPTAHYMFLAGVGLLASKAGCSSLTLLQQ